MPKDDKRGMVLRLKTWLKILSISIVAPLVCMAIVFISNNIPQCCLCDCFRYHAPCLLDLKTGELTELGIYLAHETKAAELADPQPKQGTFSFVILGDLVGYCDTTQEQIEIEIPVEEIEKPMLCKDCRKKLSTTNTDRYVLADLYAMLDDRENHKLIPITDNMNMTLRCYAISTTTAEESGSLKLVVQGMLDKK